MTGLKKYRKQIQIAILSVVLIIGLYTIGSSLFAEKDSFPQAGEKAPDFTLRGLDGELHQLSDYHGQAVLLNFWGTFCPPCVDETPLLQQYYEQYKDQGLVILGVNLNESTVTVQGFVRQFSVTYPILLDKEQVRKQYGVNQFPTTFFISPDGMIVEKWIGELREHHLKPRVERLVPRKDDTA